MRIIEPHHESMRDVAPDRTGMIMAHAHAADVLARVGAWQPLLELRGAAVAARRPMNTNTMTGSCYTCGIYVI